MTQQTVKDLSQFSEVLAKAKENKNEFSNLHEVLNLLMDLDVTEDETAKIRYASRHLVPSATKQNPNRTALVYYNDIHDELESNSYTVEFIEAQEDIPWNNTEFIVWTES